MTPLIIDVIKLSELAPVDRAVRFYQEHSDIDFFKDLVDHMRTGIVVARPTCFFMAKMIWISPRKGLPKVQAWFVRFGIGDLRELLTCFPWPLDWIVFCRRKADRYHIWPLNRFVELAYRRKECTKNHVD